MPKFRKKPVEIEAMRWTGENQFQLMQWAEGLDTRAHWRFDGPQLFIKTLEGEMLASPGDMVICGVKGEFYPCKMPVFEASYDAVTG